MKNKDIFNYTVLQYSALKSTVVQYNRWHTGAGFKWRSRKSYWLEEGEEVGDGRAEGSLAVGDGGRATISLMPDGTGGASWLGYIYPLIQWWLGHSSFFSLWMTRQHWIAFWTTAATFLYHSTFEAWPHRPTVTPQIKKIPLPFSESWISLILQLLLPLVSLYPSLDLWFHQVFINKLLMLHSKEFSEAYSLQI